MASRPDQPVEDFDSLKRAIAEEERKKPAELTESPFLASVTYVVQQNMVPNEHARVSDLAARLHDMFSLEIDASKVRQILAAQGQPPTPENILAVVETQRDNLSFHHGMLRLTAPERNTPIGDLTFTDEAVFSSVTGSTPEAVWVAQRGFEALWASAGADVKWSDIEQHVQLVGYQTTTKAGLGFNLLDLFSSEFREFVDSAVVNAKALGGMMGRTPFNPDLNAARLKTIRITPSVTAIHMRVNVFNDLTGRYEDCNLRLDVQARHEVGHGILSVTSELDSARHTQLLHDLRQSILQR